MNAARRLLALGAALVVAALLAGGAGARTAAPLTLEVTFNYSGDIAVTLPDGTPVGATAGGSAPAIPAGYYTVALSGPGCVEVPYFELYGPGVGVLENLEGGELTFQSTLVDLQPDATYTWSSSAAPSQSYIFTTSGQVLGTPPQATSAPAAGGDTESNGDVVGSSLGASASTLAVTVTSSGSASLTRASRPVTRLSAGSYTIRVRDASPHLGAQLVRPGGGSITLSAAGFVGTTALRVRLSPGRWLLRTSASGHPLAFAVG